MSLLLIKDELIIRNISGRRGACSVCREDSIQLVEIRDEIVVDAHLDPGNYTCLGSYVEPLV